MPSMTPADKALGLPFSVKTNNRDLIAVDRQRTWPLIMLLLVCYIISFSGFHTLGPLSEPGRAVPETVKFDLLAAVKSIMRVIPFILVVGALLRVRKDPEWGLFTRLIPLIAFSLWGVLSALWSPIWLYSLGHALEFLLLVMIAALAALTCDNHWRFSLALRHLCVIQFVYLVLLICLSIMLPGSARIFRTDLPSESILFTGTADSTYIVNPAVIATTASFGLTLVIASGLVWDYRWARVLLLPALMVEGGVLFVTQTRMAIVTTVLLCGACLLFRGRGKMLASLCLLLAVIGTILLVMGSYLDLGTGFQERILTYVTRGQDSEELRGLGGRATTWSTVVEGFVKSPIVGNGYSMATPTGKMWYEGELRRYSAHNIFLHVVSGTGIIGGILFLWGFYWLFLPIWRGLRWGADKRLPFFTTVIMLHAFMSGIFGDSIVGPMDSISVATFVLLGVGIGRLRT